MSKKDAPSLSIDRTSIPGGDTSSSIFFILREMPTLITNKLKTIGLFTIDIKNKSFYSKVFLWMVEIVYTDKTFLLQKFSEIRRILKKYNR